MRNEDWSAIQQRIAKLSDVQVREILTRAAPDITDEEIPRVRRRASTVEQIDMNQLSTNDYVFGNPMGRINEMAFDLLALVEHPEQQPEVEQSEPMERSFDPWVSPPF